MEGTKIDPAAVVKLADSFEAKAPDLEALGGRLMRAAQPVDTGPDDLDAQTRTAVGTVKSAMEACAGVFEAVTDALDRTVKKYLATNDEAAADQRDLLERLKEIQAASKPTT